MKTLRYILLSWLLAVSATATFTSCDDMLTMSNDDVLYTDDNGLKTANDTVNTFVGILYQLQKVAVRTNLFGELRGDLTTVYSNGDVNLKNIANFTVDSKNSYNNPRDYYSVINNCNYFLANADAALSETRYQNGMTQDYYVLRAEYVAVRAIRAWLYLQLGQIYGDNIPVVETPILSIEAADEAMSNAANKMSLQQICQHFIADLEPYVGWFDYPHHGNPGRGGYSGSTPSRMSVLPIQLVLGDLYLWLASIDGNKDYARRAAEYYYQYIVWVPNATGTTINNDGYKKVNVTGYYRDYWVLEDGKYNSNGNGVGSESLWYRTSANSFGYTGNEVIAAIAMDSVAANDHFNTLRYLYSYNQEDGTTPASLGPSQPCIDYSDSQIYGEYYKAANALVADFVERDPTTLSEELRQRHFGGDTRLGSNLYTYDIVDGQEMQIISKSNNTRDVIIYRTADVYLRMAEALNYAGFPLFGKYILTTGLDNLVVQRLVLPSCDNHTDSVFVQQFNFPRTLFLTQLSEQTSNNTPVNAYYPLTSSTGASFNNLNYVNQIGIHQRGSGYPLENPKYYPAYVDTISKTDPALTYPYPVQPSAYSAVASSSSDPLKTVLANIIAANTELIDRAVAEDAEAYTAPVLDDYPVAEWENLVINYRDALRAYSSAEQAAWRLQVVYWQRDHAKLIRERQEEVVDSLLDVESALETCFEGFRFGYLMRADYRCGGRARKMGGGRTFAPGQYLAEKVGKRDASLQGKLTNRNNWFIGWKDAQSGASIGVNTQE